jgi:TPR repeat protein
VIYANGHGVPADDKEAVKRFRLAADQGNANAQYNLGLIYEIGAGVSEDNKEAVKWYQMAADQGHIAAQN